jgi:hypothetical protein
VRHIAPPGYVTVADASGVWSRGMTGLKEALTEIWLPSGGRSPLCSRRLPAGSKQ